MPAREAYARGYVKQSGVECTVGIEIADGDDVEMMTIDAKVLGEFALLNFGGNHMRVTDYVEHGIRANYPGRAYFIETEEDGKGVQVYQPMGMPRESQ